MKVLRNASVTGLPSISNKVSPSTAPTGEINRRTRAIA